VAGEALRCPYHGFHFSIDGSLAKTPLSYPVNGTYQRNCRARHYHVDQRFGEIWISPDPGAAKVDDLSGAETTFHAERVIVTGEIRTWLDHFLDVGHIPAAHSRSLLERAPDKARVSAEFRFSASSSFPCRGAGIASIQGLNAPAWFHYLASGGGVGFLSKFMCERDRTVSLEVKASMIAPATQELHFRYTTRFGEFLARNITVLNPQGDGQIEMSLIGTSHAKSPVRAFLDRRILARRMVLAHILAEDGAFLSRAKVTDLARFNLTPLDQTVLALRTASGRYFRERSAFFAEVSLIRSLMEPESPKLSQVTKAA
jgi:hypothetical protein